MTIETGGSRDGELSVRGLSKRFGGSRVLSDITFSVIPGEILGLIGPNGAGKTTLLESITGLCPVESGTVCRHGRELGPEERRRILWYQPDNILPFARQRVATTLSFFRHVHGAATAELDELITGLALDAILAKPLQTLSKGYRRRVLLAIALLSRQPLLMLDEPFDGFDLRQALSVMDLLRRHVARRTMILSIHQLSEAEKICDRFLLLDQGRLLGIGTLEALARQAGLAPDATLEEVFLALT